MKPIYFIFVAIVLLTLIPLLILTSNQKDVPLVDESTNELEQES